MKVKPVAVGKRRYVSKRDGIEHTAYTVVFQDGDSLTGASQVDGIAPVPGVELDVRIGDCFEIRKPWTGTVGG